MESGPQDTTPEPTAPLGSTASSISTALASNLALQLELKHRLTEVRRRKFQNRLHATQVTKSLSLCLVNKPYRDSPENSSHFPVDGGASTGYDLQTHPLTVDDTSTPRVANPNRKWMRHFFVDSDESTPDISICGDPSLDKSAHEIKPQCAWSKTDVVMLQNVVNETLHSRSCANNHENTANEISSIPWDDASFFEQIASKFLDTNPTRSPIECQTALLTFADVNIVNTKFTKEESLFILREVKSQGGNVNWHELAIKLNSNFYSDPLRRTPWQCFKNYRSNLLDSSNFLAWTADEDELLLKYIAAHGPQFIFGEGSISQACQQLFIQREPKSLAIRAHNTLVNPNLVQETWDTNDQRKLVLLMRAYNSDQEKHTISNSTHFPHRAMSSVTSKWDRSLNPAISCKPFSEAEEKKLLAAVKNLGSDEGSFVSIAKTFPNRTANSLWYHWSHIADEKDIADRLKNRLIKKNISGKKRVFLEGDDMFTMDDFVVQKKKSKRK
eukprot:scaffold75592_cov75-Cyclotella_meneghiniana.AAC.9